MSLTPSVQAVDGPSPWARLSVIVPCYNEAHRLPETVPLLLTYLRGLRDPSEILFVDDGSRDGTPGLLRSFEAASKGDDRVRIRVITLPVNRGKGRAVRTALLASTSAAVLLCDADLSTPIEELERLGPLLHENDLVVGTRKAKTASIVVSQPRIRVVMGAAFSSIAQWVLGVPVSDFTCGFKLLRREAAHDIASVMVIDRWAYDAELLKVAAVRGYRIAETGVRWSDRPGSKVRILRDTFQSGFDLLRVVFLASTGRYGRKPA